MRVILTLLVLIATTATVSAQQRTPQEILQQIDSLLVELKDALEPPPPPPPPPPPSETVVTTSAELTAALEQGGTIRLSPGTYTGTFTVSVPGTRLLGVAGLPEARVTPEQVAAVTLVAGDPYKAVLSVQASDVRVEGLTARPARTDREVIVVGQWDATSAETQPADVVIDRVAVLAGEAGGLRGISLHARGVTVSRSYVAGFWYRYRDSQAIWINNGPGPYTLRNNYLEGSGENILVGGAEIYIPDCVPSDIMIDGNTIHKPEAWRAYGGSVKNSVELKVGRRVQITNNVIDGNWRDAQGGDTIVFTPRNPSGRNPWIVVDDVLVRGNIVTRATQGYVVSILGTDNNQPTQQTARITVDHNLFADATGGVKILGGVAGHLTVTNNTFPTISGNWFLFSSTMVKTPLTVTGNVAKSGAYGISGGTTVGEPSLLANTEGAVFTGNVIEKYCCRTIRWPADNLLLEPGALSGVLDPVTFKYPNAAVGY